jgi:hypothetical protein
MPTKVNQPKKRLLCGYRNASTPKKLTASKARPIVAWGEAVIRESPRN